MPFANYFPIVSALQYDGTNASEVMDHLDALEGVSPSLEGSTITIMISGHIANEVMNPGDWIVRRPGSAWEIALGDDFATWNVAA